MLTLNEIRNVNFRKSNFGGYRAEDVEAFIDEVQLSYDSLLKENAELLKRLESLTAKLEEYQQEEDSIRNALMNAQKVGDASLRDAKHKAEIILKDATIKAEKIVSNAQIEIHRERDVIEKMQRDIADFKAKLLKVYKEHLTIINSIPNEEIMRQDTKDSLASVPMLDRDTNPYANQPMGMQDDYSYGANNFSPIGSGNDNFAGSNPAAGGFGGNNGFGTQPDSNFPASASNSFDGGFGMPAQDMPAQNDFARPTPDSRPEQPIMPRERMNQSRGGFTVNIDDDMPAAPTTTLPPPAREQQRYSSFDSQPSYGAPQGGINNFDRQPIVSDDYSQQFNYNDGANTLGGSDDFGMPAYDTGMNNAPEEGPAGLFRRRR
ncbi:MAG: DivIVA domain-containing protein [Acutalibacteraceae bacterium]